VQHAPRYRHDGPTLLCRVRAKASDLFAMSDIDEALIGGSLVAKDIATITSAVG